MSETRKSIKFSVLLDTSEVPQAVKAMQRQMEQANTSTRMSQQGFGGGMIPKPEEIAKSRTALAQFIREQAQQQERLLGLINKQSGYVDNANKKAKDGLLTEEEKVKAINRQITAKRTLDSLEQAYDSRQKVLSKALDVNAGKGGGVGAGAGMGLGMLGKFGLGVAIPTTAVAVLEMIKKAVTQYAAVPREITTATGSATQDLVGSQMQGMQGDTIRTMAFKPEWMASLREAKQERDTIGREFLDRITSMKGLAASVIEGGKIHGFRIRNIPGMAAIGKEMESGFQSEQMQTQMQHAMQNYAAKLQNDPLKMAAVNKYSQNYMRDLGAQRMMGLSDQGYYGAGGFQERMNKGGFNEELGLGMAGQIQAAGGSTRGMSGLSQLGLQAQRGFDMTNAGGVLGRISGSAGGDKSSEQIFRKLMEESIKAGLDKSEFREEQRRFTDTASEILSNSGVKTADDAANVLSGLTKMLGGEPTVRGIEGAKGAFQQVQNLTSQTSGRGGALQMASFMKDRQLKKLGAAGFGELMAMPEETMIGSNEDIIGAAAEIGNISPEELATKLKTLKHENMLQTMGLNPDEVQEFANSKEGKAFRASGGKDTSLLTRKQLATWRKIQKQSRFSAGYQGPQQQAAFNMGVLGGEGTGTVSGFQGKSGSQEYGDYLTSISGGGRMADTAVAASGQVSQEFLENFREFSKAITPSTEAVSEWTKMLIMSAQVLRFTAEGDKAGAQKALADAMAKAAKTQSQVTR